MSSDLLAGLTAERLDELAARIDRTMMMFASDPSPIHFLSGPDAQSVAAALRAVAGAERKPGWSINILGVGAGYGVSNAWGFGSFETHPTLISALASVAKQEEP